MSKVSLKKLSMAAFEKYAKLSKGEQEREADQQLKHLCKEYGLNQSRIIVAEEMPRRRTPRG